MTGSCQAFLAISGGLLLGARGEGGQGGVALLGLLLGGGLQVLVGGVLEGLALGVAADRAGPAAQRAARADAAGPAEHAGLAGELLDVAGGEPGAGVGGADGDRSGGGQHEGRGADQGRRGRNSGKEGFAKTAVGTPAPRSAATRPAPARPGLTARRLPASGPGPGSLRPGWLGRVGRPPNVDRTAPRDGTLLCTMVRHEWG